MGVWLLLQGQSLGSAAYLRALRREAIGEYSVEDAWSFEELLNLGNERRAQRRAAGVALNEGGFSCMTDSDRSCMGLARGEGL